ncbi:hypothetical protein BUALT_Bualt11G0115300 [Buddleja alternifolia]|uniref:Ribosomal protein S24e family protein n=1 Tax=Buddleja alternifolia TaxID=168488 RepID=A0AAV6X2V1_9LAMI|nr:hypothetical protein BUALT_Bualt11G0115300 [Buddleja alternifolia]
MSQLSRAALKCSRLMKTAQPNGRLLSTLVVAPKLFSTEAAEPRLGSSEDQFLKTPSSGLVYGKLTNITKYTTRSDMINLLEGCNLNPENLKVEYNRIYLPMSMMVEFPSRSAYDAALRAIGRKGRLFNLLRADKSQWDVVAPYDGKTILLTGIPRNALIDDVERFLSGCQYDSTSLEIFPRQTYAGLVRMALVRFPSKALAMHAYVTKNRGFCLNNQVTVQVLH